MEERLTARRPYQDHPSRSSGTTPGKLAAIVAGTLVMFAAIGFGLYLFVFDGGGDAQAEYRGKVNAAMEDVVAANEDLSDGLSSLQTRRSPATERAPSRSAEASVGPRLRVRSKAP